MLGSNILYMPADADKEVNGKEPEAPHSPDEINRDDGVQLEGECQWFHFQKGFGFIHNCNDGGTQKR